MHHCSHPSNLILLLASIVFLVLHNSVFDLTSVRASPGVLIRYPTGNVNPNARMVFHHLPDCHIIFSHLPKSPLLGLSCVYFARFIIQPPCLCIDSYMKSCRPCSFICKVKPFDHAAPLDWMFFPSIEMICLILLKPFQIIWGKAGFRNATQERHITFPSTFSYYNFKKSRKQKGGLTIQQDNI